MSVDSSQERASLTSPSLRYRGLAGAVSSGLLTLGVITLIGVGLAVLVWLATKSLAPALQLGIRFALVGAAAGGASTLSRLICGTATDRLVTLRLVKGESSGTLGLLGGLVLAGCLAERLPTAHDAAATPLAIGQTVELSGPTVDGGRFDLVDQRGKVVLVDFWATWCGPCLAELPNVRAVHDQYHADGVEVVGISLDFERAALVKFLKAHPEPWPQVFFASEGTRGFENPLAKRYGIEAIPHLLVIDREGKLAARDVRGREIEAAVARALGKPVFWGDRVAAAGSRLLGWLLNGVLTAPWWLLLLCTVGGAIMLACAERLVRRAFA